MTKIYLASYKGQSAHWQKRVLDWLIRKATKGQYSHCEIAVKHSGERDHYHLEEWFECYSASSRDNGVRKKIINMADRTKWDLIELKGVDESQIVLYFNLTKGKGYDLCGALGLIFGFTQKRQRFFCSEWCFNALFISDEGWRFSPNQLAEIIKIKELK